MKPVVRFLLRQWPLSAAVASAILLAAAHGFEQIGGLEPCALCLRQREVYWAALGLGLAGAVLQRVPGKPWLVRLVCAALAVTFLVGVGVAAYHAGVEWKWWPGPQACAAGGDLGAGVGAGIDAMLGGAKVAPPACDKAAWIFLGLSMAGWNALISLVLAGFSIAAAVRRPWLAPKDASPAT
jgi:disulfide bond formation protein DsbB